ncbi:MAG: Secretion protein HlyD family protein [uncultured Thiotrichaceae bacterium]|uniref:Secretion protein HlyD family protein n=1 Tax=uncultured Thiotrichaceae bacterium TaxID=298394 RepID=A0A6S6SE56_9GAMM|nr:MAG: Secretion protein HlyD family protein [uncultured Thiotrichaceae bacterium]
MAIRKILSTIVILLTLSNYAFAVNVKGRLEWVNKIEMRVLESGVVEKVTVNPGDRIKKGQLLLRMDQRETAAKLLQANAQIAKADIGLADAIRALERTQELFDRGLIAEEEMKDAELILSAAEADQQAAKANQAAAQVSHERTELRSPFNGIVISRNTFTGDVIYKTLQQTPLISIAQNQQMLARVLLTAGVIQKYKKGQVAKVAIRGKNYTGKIHSLGVEPVRIDMNGAVYELDVIFNNTSHALLRPAESVLVSLP